MYIVVEGEDPGFDIFVNGRSLARHEDALERLALRLGVRPLIEFFSADENSMSLLIEEGAGNQELMRRLPPPQWYSPEDGLRTVRALLMAFFSFLGSMITMHSGKWFIVRMPFKLRYILRYSRFKADCIFLE